MSSTLLPFLYQTRTLQTAIGLQPITKFIRSAHTARGTKSRIRDNSIPFEWDHDTPYEELAGAPGQQSTITPSEAEVFKGIFDEIAQGKMPASKKRPTLPEGAHLQSETSDEPKSGMARSIVEQARVMEFREKSLRRYPASLRNAAQVALGLFELEPSDSAASQMMELDEADQAKWEERAKYERARVEERERVDALMKACETDGELWKVMEKEVFSLPAKLGITQTKRATGRGKTAKARGKAVAAEQAQTADEEKRVMDVHGPLYPHFINTAMGLFDTAFTRPSDYAFQILPRVKELGLPSYVLGVSTPFYARLARMHWNRYGDANSALDVLQEMNSTGLYADEDVHELLITIRDHLHGCTWGAQGPFVMGMMEAPPYDGMLTQRLQGMERYVVHSIEKQAERAM